MHVLELKAENFKRLQAVLITPDGALVDVQGRNGQGKTSTLDAIYAALGGQGAIPGKPIRKGQDHGIVQLKLGTGESVELVVRRTFASREDGGFTTSLTVENAEGGSLRSPQTLLDSLLGALSFDPLAFTRKKPEDQLQDLRMLVPGVDFDAIDAQNRGDYERRTEVNRQIKKVSGQLSGIVVPGDPRHERIDEAALVAELERTGEQKTEIERERARRLERIRDVRGTAVAADEARREVVRCTDAIEELKEQLEHLEGRAKSEEARAAQLDERAKTAQAELEALPALEAPPDTTELVSRIQQARLRNEAVDARERAMKERERLAGELKTLEAQAKGFSEAIGQRQVDKAAAVASANLPVEGLAFGDDEVVLNGLPLSQASGAEQLRVSMAVAAALNPKLRIACIRDGNGLDRDGVRMLAEFAAAQGMQVWRECVADDAKVGIVIEDGRLKVAEVAA